ncbi:MAG: hypothetical protein WBW28_05815 [Pseudolabrys sp.]
MATERTQPELASRDDRRRRREFNSLFWLCGCGGVAAFALIALTITSQTETANERLRRIFASGETSAIAGMPPRVAQLESETQLLVAQVRALTTERDRLSGRIALLESSIDDMSGAIKKQAAATAALLAARVNPPTTSPTVTSTPIATNPPTINADRDTTTASIPPNPTPKTDTPALATPMPPARIANASAIDIEQPASRQSEFGMDLGGGVTIEGVRQRWTTVKANFGPVLNGLRPLATRDHRPGANGFRLIVGPLPNSAAATGLCAHFVAARTACRAVKFEGEQIAQH